MHLTADLHTCLSKNSIYRTKLSSLFGLQEPPVFKGKIVGFGSPQRLISSNKNGDPKAAIYTSRSLHIWPMMEFCDRDTAVGLWKTGNNITKSMRLLLCLSFFSGEGLSLDHGQYSIQILLPSHYSFLLELAHYQSYCQCAQRSTFRLSAALPLRKAHLFPPKGEPTFCATLVGEIARATFPPL